MTPELQVGLRLLFEVWGSQEGYVALPRKEAGKNGQWRENKGTFFKWPGERASIRRYITKQVDGTDNLYWCPTVLDAPRRRAANVLPTRLTWADLDDVDPDSVYPRPSYAWESSDRRYQGLWVTDTELQPDRAAELSKRIAYSVGADYGGWDLTQVLRIPGTRNFKYASKPMVTICESKGASYAVTDLEDSFVPLPDSRQSDDSFSLPDTTPSRIVRKYQSKFTPRIRKLLADDTSKVKVGKEGHSGVLWELECRLIEVGLTPGEVVILVRASAWNKFRGRKDELERLWSEVHKAAAQTATVVGSGSDLQGEDRAPVFVSYSSFMAAHIPVPAWLAEGFWVEGSHGIVAGEPKTYKSTVVLDLAVSVASGRPFLGEFPVHAPGPVVVIQDENSTWTMQDRIRKIAASKGLTGTTRELGSDVELSFPGALPITLLNRYGYSLLEEADRSALETHIQSIHPRLIVLDPLYLMLGDADENSSKDLRPVLSWLLQLSTRYQTAVLLIHHSGKSRDDARGGKRMLGSTTLHGWTDSALYISLVSEPEDDYPTIAIEREFRSFPHQKSVELSFEMGEPGELTYIPTLRAVEDKFTQLSDWLRINKDAGASVQQVMDAFNLSRQKANRFISQATEKGLVEIEGGGKGVRKVIKLPS